MRNIPFLSPIAVVAASALFMLSGVAHADDVFRLNQAEALRLAVAKPQPAYPVMARQLRLEGQVQVEAEIAEDGSVTDARPLSGNAVLANAAATAAKHWRFQPVKANGKTVKAVADITFTFKM